MSRHELNSNLLNNVTGGVWTQDAQKYFNELKDYVYKQKEQSIWMNIFVKYYDRRDESLTYDMEDLKLLLAGKDIDDRFSGAGDKF